MTNTHGLKPSKDGDKFIAVGMRISISVPNSLVINTCGNNDKSEAGSFESWSWANPTNRIIKHEYLGYEAVSVECLWQGTKIFVRDGVPNPKVLEGDWRKGKAKRPIGAWNGSDPLISDPGMARRKIYIPAYRRLIEHWMQYSVVQKWVSTARLNPGPVFLRDFDTGRGIDRRGPVSHAWILSEYLNGRSFDEM